MKTASFVAALLAAGPAAAQTIVDTPSGPRIELRAGWDRADIVNEVHDGSDRYESSIGASGVTYGAEVGYDIVTGGSVIGLYAGIAGANTKECATLAIGVTPIATDCISFGREITVGGRVGFATGGNALVYLKGGYSNGRFVYDYRSLLVPTVRERLTGDNDGFHVGAGGELGIGRHAYGKLEYVYTNYAGSQGVEDGFRTETGMERHQLVAGLGYRF